MEPLPSPSSSSLGAKELQRQAKDGRYLDTLMDVLDDSAILMHPEYKFKPSYDDPRFSMIKPARSSPNNSNNNNNNNNNGDDRSPDRPNTSQSLRSRASSRAKTPDLTPEEYLEKFEDKLVPYDEAIDPVHGTLDYTKYVGDKIQEQVAEGVKEWAKYANGPPGDPELPFSRCVVCTLPFGSCSHTREWMNYKSPASRKQQEREAVESTLFDMDDVLNIGSETMNEELKKGIRTTAFPLNQISHMHWTKVTSREADAIEGRKMDLSSPPCMGGSSGVMIPNPVGQPHLVIHGGIRYPRNGVFHAYSSTLIGSRQLATYERRVFVYNMVEMTWHVVEQRGDPEDEPKGRYGHCAVVLSDRTMWTFGGRQKAGVCSDEVHIWNFDEATWKSVKYNKDIVRVPAPRFGASAAFVPSEGKEGSVVLFGGRDGSSNFGTDWSDPVCIGIPPSPRHGHSVLGMDDGRIMVLGGCCVSPAAETGIPDNIDELDDKMQAAAKRVEECYKMERVEAELAGMILESESDYRGWKELARLSAQAAAAVAKREKDTADAENDLNSVMQERSAAVHWAKMNSQHGSAYVNGVHDGRFVDVTLLDVQAKVWTEPTAPPCTGRLPEARMNHTAVHLAGKVIMIGGCRPTSSRVVMSDGDVHVLDVESWKWSVPSVEETP
eukprot:CAMPEP_0118671362 /NCGR_PEP_ID=MMETSP0785-20121206/21961_1 /TAXON_ID=91992 /ORGANISM="Bolidomonas pacifica, Strain CCMP 1866" /LENGTH=663 /DNA_ID=CAMNT_0006566241 /DNA_START=171 /DNA_END=2158 /DNA_ORIENTATION=+